MFDRPILLLNGRSASRLRQVVQYHKDAFVYIKVLSEFTAPTSKTEPVSSSVPALGVYLFVCLPMILPVLFYMLETLVRHSQSVNLKLAMEI